ncbi:FAD-dependent oxidoreductase [Agromyces tropicus]|uniref:ferredoxin--NADP(+) reductase n=1 Tax=Agromyces tropicus TaxID=555371 RepID=A0ABN2U1A1_9MICO
MRKHAAAPAYRSTVAIVGSGPSGCYTAQFLRKSWPGSEITVFEAMPMPYGLVRYGIAADHQGAKAVTSQFDRVFTRMDVMFAGNVEIGSSVTFDELHDAFDVVVLATGLPDDRGLGVPQDDTARVVGAGELVRALNGHPDAGRTLEPVGEAVIVVGQGNVSMDVVRMLSKTGAELDGSDIEDAVLQRLRPEPVRVIHVVGRSGAAAAKFDIAMLRELGTLSDVSIGVTGLGDDEGAIPELLSELAARDAAAVPERRTRVIFHFGATPASIGHDGQRTVLTVVDSVSGDERALQADTIITAIGFCNADTTPATVPDEEWSGDRVYRVGWLGRGPRGTVAENRKHAQSVAQTIVADAAAGRFLLGRPGLRAVWPRIQHDAVTFDDWRLIDEVERTSAGPGRCRRKITDLAELLEVVATKAAISA